ncbi:MAG: bifunctional precorrin-2 dehydrogenase/sirohydrochlorin ferrochelatase [Anaerolineae bacterium]|nr:bifunctional precorrin-2 dehydrogenase/sirohydrochlorin ferrochelatase [Anaerolineae bacterium]MCB0179802.1 bifunctional precorrin-2 dehydrogenase/sirohydrochlorin ferrochelatase [Anaerolineae bacterium]MCB0225693.1 bifunctional precorrin-2 dehydrogenase/sirohydrochlorin ferrochelatase [Anaerolineae bacterium]MCB9106224.1 bifunctional precorrin-2 dehydrogenase/sirohydrochlorin ferrochelatase [Anaerolineales bacterium]
MKTYPVNLVLDNRLVVLIGANHEIARKISGLLEVGARVRVIAPKAHPTIQRYAAEEQIEWLVRRYKPGDLTGAALVIANTGDQTVHDQIWVEGQTNGQLVNIMDVIPQCNFHAASVVRQGQLTIAIGTGGAAPALAATLRKRFEQGFGPEYAEFLEYAQALRPIVAERIPTFKRRAEFWYDLVESNAVTLLRNGEHALFEAKVHMLLSLYEQEAVEVYSSSKES